MYVCMYRVEYHEWFLKIENGFLYKEYNRYLTKV